MIRFACFDLDGTLLDTLDGITAAANHALGDLNFPVWPAEDYRAFIGYGPIALGKHVLPADISEEAEKQWLSRYKEHYLEEELMKAVPYSGIRSALQALQADGIYLAVLSNKPHELVIAQVAEFFPHIFSEVRGQLDGVRTKPDPAGLLQMAANQNFDPAACAYIGDMPVDIETACNAGFLPVGALWGFGKRALLRQYAGRATLITQANELPIFFASHHNER